MTKKNLTTNQGVPVSDNQNSLTVGRRGPTLLQDVHLIEKLAHFDHERIPERVVHAKGAGALGYFQPYKSMSKYTCSGFLQRAAKKNAGLCAFLDRGRFEGFGGHSPRPPRFLHQVLYRGRQLRPGGKQPAGVLYPGRDQVPGHGARL